MPEFVTKDGKTRAKLKATMGAAFIYGPNNPKVLSGEVPLGHREGIAMDEPGPQLVELTYQECVAFVGEENADELFRGIPEEER